MSDSMLKVNSNCFVKQICNSLVLLISLMYLYNDKNLIRISWDTAILLERYQYHIGHFDDILVSVIFLPIWHALFPIDVDITTVLGQKTKIRDRLKALIY